MAVVKNIGIGLGVAVLTGVLDGGVARLLMRGVALAVQAATAFSLEASLGIMLIFAITATPLAVTAKLTSRRGARLTAGLIGTAVLGFSAVNIGLEEVNDAGGLDALHRLWFYGCVAGLAAVVLLQPWLILRLAGALSDRKPLAVPTA